VLGIPEGNGAASEGSAPTPETGDPTPVSEETPA
jgi:hypothetical protein